MQTIKDLSDYIESELNDAEEYITKALAYKGLDNALADMYYNLSTAESSHASLLHDQGVRLIKEYQEKGETIPQAMQAIYDYLHKKHIEHANNIAVVQSKFRA